MIGWECELQVESGQVPVEIGERERREDENWSAHEEDTSTVGDSTIRVRMKGCLAYPLSWLVSLEHGGVHAGAPIGSA
jgi:hypothetical protein